MQKLVEFSRRYGSNPELVYLTMIRSIRDTDKPLFERIKRLPKKSKTGRYSDMINGNSTVTFIRKGALKEFFITGHSEYAPLTLDGEYKRDVAKRLPIQLPKNYYEDDNPAKKPIVRWRAHANLLFSNWLNYYVYQKTPFDINQIV